MLQIEWVNPKDVRSDRPIYRPLLNALTRGDTPEERVITAGDLRISPRFRSPEAHVALMLSNFATHERIGEEFLHRVLVMERSDGSLWVYDDCAYVEAAQQLDPSMPVACGVFKAPTR